MQNFMAVPERKVGQATTAACDLRPWLEAVEEIGQLERVSGGHWDLEIGALTEIILGKLSAPPALLFDNVPGYGAGDAQKGGGEVGRDARRDRGKTRRRQIRPEGQVSL